MHSAVKLCAQYIDDEKEGSAHSFTAHCCVDIKEAAVLYLYLYLYLSVCVFVAVQRCACVCGD